MSTALVLSDDGRRENGRWKRGSVGIGESPNSETWRDAVKKAGVILDHAPHLAADVIDGGVASGIVRRGLQIVNTCPTGKSSQLDTSLASEGSSAAQDLPI